MPEVAKCKKINKDINKLRETQGSFWLLKEGYLTQRLATLFLTKIFFYNIFFEIKFKS